LDRRRRERRAQSDANRPGAILVEARIGIARHIKLVAVYGDDATRIITAEGIDFTCKGHGSGCRDQGKRTVVGDALGAGRSDITHIGQRMPIHGQVERAFGFGAEACRHGAICEVRQCEGAKPVRSGVWPEHVEKNFALDTRDIWIVEDRREGLAAAGGIGVADILDAADHPIFGRS
jgi:hypothetical protein